MSLFRNVISVKKKTTRPRGLLLVLKVGDTKLSFNVWSTCSFNFSQKHNLNRPGQIFWSSTSQVICHLGPAPSPADSYCSKFLSKRRRLKTQPRLSDCSAREQKSESDDLGGGGGVKGIFRTRNNTEGWAKERSRRVRMFLTLERVTLASSLDAVGLWFL